MATLRAHGSEMARVSKQIQLTDCVCTTEKILMSDGVVLVKDTFVRSDGSRHSHGYKRGGRTTCHVQRWYEIQSGAGYTR